MSTCCQPSESVTGSTLYDVFSLYCDGKAYLSRDLVIHGNVTSAALQLQGHRGVGSITEEDWKRIGNGKPPPHIT